MNFVNALVIMINQTAMSVYILFEIDTYTSFLYNIEIFY